MPFIWVTIRKLGNTKKVLLDIIMLVNYGNIYRWTMSSLYPSVYTNINCMSVYTEQITVRKKWKKKKNFIIIYDIANKLIANIHCKYIGNIFKLWPN